MTLPATGSMSLSDVLTELKIVTPSRTAPISLGDADVLALAGKGAVPISLSDLYGKSSYVALAVTPHDASAFAFSTSSGGTVFCTPSVSVTGGSGGTTYLWSFTSNPDGCTLSNSTLATCRVSHTYAHGDSGAGTAILSCLVSDNTGHSTTATGVNATLEWEP